jgi:hypothetical protein
VLACTPLSQKSQNIQRNVMAGLVPAMTSSKKEARMLRNKPGHHVQTYTSARRFVACSAREVIVDTASSLLRLASAITFDALVAKTCAAFCIF